MSAVSESSYIIEVSHREFAERVIAASKQQPVLVDFSAEWCGPCQMLEPVLIELVRAYNGRFLLAKVDIDKEPELAKEHQVKGVPMLKLYAKGKLAAQFVGMQSAANLKAALDRCVERDSDALRQQGVQARDSGNLARAAALLQEAMDHDPENHRIHPDLAECLLRLGQPGEAEALLKMLPANLQAEDSATKLFIRIRLAKLANEVAPADELERHLAAHPSDTDARYQLAVHQILNEEYEQAMDNLLEVIRNDRSFGHDTGRKTLLDLFTLLGTDDARVRHYRSQLALALN
jgi:putative thioredoxin